MLGDIEIINLTITKPLPHSVSLSLIHTGRGRVETREREKYPMGEY